MSLGFRFAAVSALLVCVGCGGADGVDGRMAVTGAVQFESQPLDQGTIEFVSDEGTSGATISEGTYEIPAEKGLQPGDYTVRIYSSVGGNQDFGDAAPGESEVVATERVSTEFNVNSTLKASVTADGPNQFDFSVSGNAGSN